MNRQNTILLADDELWFKQELIEELEESGYRVVTAPNGEQAIKQIKNEQIDLIILDIMMPIGKNATDPKNPTDGDEARRTGVRIAQQIREELKLKTPIIYLTVVTDQTVHSRIQLIERSVGLEYTRFIKPIVLQELIDAVRTLLGKSQ